MNEEWREIPSFPKYEVSNLGNVRSKRYGKVIPGSIQKDSGYVRISVYKDYFRVHRAVAEAFLGRSDSFVNHKDGNKQNNRLDNLEYVSSAENVRHAFRTGLMKTKLSTSDCEDVVKLRKAGVKLKDLASFFDISLGGIKAILYGKCYRLQGSN